MARFTLRRCALGLSCFLAACSNRLSDPLADISWDSTDDVAIPSPVELRAYTAQNDYRCGVRRDGAMVCWWASISEAHLFRSHAPIVASTLGASSDLPGCLLTAEHEVACWSDLEELYSGPPIIQGLARSRAIPVALASSQTHGCALLSNGRVACWGDNGYGQHGQGVDSSCANLEPGDWGKWWTAEIVPGIPRIVQVATGDAFTCGLDRNGIVHCWGRQELGSLGRAPETRCGEPQPVAHLPPITQISAASMSVCTLDEEGGVRCWGSIDPDPDHHRIWIPCRVPLPRPARYVEVSEWSTRAILDDGRVLKWYGWHHCEDGRPFEFEELPADPYLELSFVGRGHR